MTHEPETQILAPVFSLLVTCGSWHSKVAPIYGVQINMANEWVFCAQKFITNSIFLSSDFIVQLQHRTNTVKEKESDM